MNESVDDYRKRIQEELDRLQQDPMPRPPRPLTTDSEKLEFTIAALKRISIGLDNRKLNPDAEFDISCGWLTDSDIAKAVLIKLSE